MNWWAFRCCAHSCSACRCVRRGHRRMDRWAHPDCDCCHWIRSSSGWTCWCPEPVAGIRSGPCRICVSGTLNSSSSGASDRGACTGTVPPGSECPNLCKGPQRHGRSSWRSLRGNPGSEGLVTEIRRRGRWGLINWREWRSQSGCRASTPDTAFHSSQDIRG